MKPDNWILVRGARQLVTLHHLNGPRRGGDLAQLGVIPDGSVLLRNGVIVAVGPTRRIENISEARDADEVNASGRMVMPAFIDSHACLSPVPSYFGDASPESYRCAAIRAIQALPASRLEAQADGLLKTMSRHGTATVGAVTGYGIDNTGELKILRALQARNKKPLDIVSIVFSMGHASQQDAGNHEPQEPSEDLLAVVAHRRLATVAQARCGAGGISLAAAEAFLGRARSLGLGVRLEMLTDHDPGTVDAAIKLNALSITPTGAFRSSEVESVSYSSTFAILLPALASTNGGHARQLVDQGGLIALGSGISPETRATASMQTVVQLACEQQGLSIGEAISAATINAAWALGLGTTCGSLEKGKAADLILLNASDYREIPLLAGTNLTYLLMKRGVVVFKEDFPGWPSPA